MHSSTHWVWASNTCHAVELEWRGLRGWKDEVRRVASWWLTVWWLLLHSLPLDSLENGIGAERIHRVVHKSADVVDKQRVEKLSDLLLVGEVEGSFEWNPNTLQMHWPDLNNVPLLLTFQDAISASSGHSSNVEQLGSVDHVVVLSSGNTNTVCLDLKAQTSLIFPQHRSNLWFRARWGDLTGCIHWTRRIAITLCQWSTRAVCRRMNSIER